MNSLMREMPGPEVAVKARAPAQPAPMTIPIEASSSSAWTMPAASFPEASLRWTSQNSMKLSQRLDDGVIGYQAQNIAPPKRQPRADAELPSTMIFPAVASIRSTLWGIFPANVRAE